MGQNGCSAYLLHRDAVWCLLHLRISTSLYGVSVHQWVKLSAAAAAAAAASSRGQGPSARSSS